MEEIHMRQCPKCGTPIEDGSTFCTTCGLKIEPQPAEAPKPQNNAYNPNFGAAPNMGAGNPNPVYQQPPYAPQPPMPPADPYDHTAEFDAKDISDNLDSLPEPATRLNMMYLYAVDEGLREMWWAEWLL